MNLKMSLKQLATRGRLPFYIDNDGRPIGETQCHVENVCYLLEPLDEWFRADPQVFVAGAMVLHYEKGRRDRYLSPDVFVVRGIPKGEKRDRRNYLVWEEGRAPDMVIELTSELTQDEDQIDKRTIYQDVLRVREYFLFDPFEEYLHPRLQGFRLASGQYRPIRPVKGRLPSKVLGLHLEADGDLLRLYNPTTRRRLPIPPEVRDAQKRAEAARRKEADARRKEADARQKEADARREAEAEVGRLRRELEALRRRLTDRP